MTELLASLTESQAAYRYAEGKWTLKEVVGHITDAERVMTYRLLRFARGPDAFDRFRSGIIHTSFRKLDNRAIGRRLPGRTAINDYITARATSGGVDPQGTANNLSITARALAYSIAGHELHHMGVIRNRYLS